MNEPKRHAPAAERNKQPILDVLRRVLPREGTLLEVASGSGQHVLHFAAALPSVTFQPSDKDPEALASISAYLAEARPPNVNAPLSLDVLAAEWPLSSADAVLAINMIHIAPWEATLALFDGAARLLPRDGPCVLYGPYRRGGEHTAPSNLAFDESLRARDPAWGVRDLEAVTEAASARGLVLDVVEPMPANNLSVVFRKRR